MAPVDPILGNDAVRERLWRASDAGRLHHCYLFEGPEGVGKATTALRLALYANCLADGARPCGACGACRLILAGTHPDVMTVGCDPQRTTRIISADQAREIIGSLQLQRHSARRRVVILDPADAMGEEAANALLKTFEEPPQGTMFVLVTARPAALLPTVRSRSQRVRFGPVPADALGAWLRQRGLDPALAAASLGSPGLCLRLAEGEAAARRDVRDALLGAVGQPLHRLFAFTEAHGKKGEGVGTGAEAVVDALEEVLREVVLVAAGREDRLLDPTRADVYRRWAQALWPGGVARMERALAAARDRLSLNVNGRIVLEALFAQLNLELSQARPA